MHGPPPKVSQGTRKASKRDHSAGGKTRREGEGGFSKGSLTKKKKRGGEWFQKKEQNSVKKRPRVRHTTPPWTSKGKMKKRVSRGKPNE